jgi:hypothetical protein
MFDVLILLAKIKKWFGQFGDLGGLFFGVGVWEAPQYFVNFTLKPCTLLYKNVNL